MSKQPIYLDYAATTPVDPLVAEAMSQCLLQTGTFGNPSSLHIYGQTALAQVELARSQVAAAINAIPSEIIWTSGATESNNLALKGAVSLYRRRGNHIITLKTEHKAVLDACGQLEKEGFSVSYLKPDRNGLLDPALLKATIRPETVLVSIMHVNNETGVIQDLAALSEVTRAANVLLHVDAAQSIGKVSLDLQQLPIDFVSLCAHKCYGPKGIGALYLRKKPRVRVQPFIHGGGHEQGMRSGTLATHQIVGMGKAFELCTQNAPAEQKRIRQLRDQLVAGLQTIPNFRLNMQLDCVVPHIINVRFEGMIAQAILPELKGLALSTGSACQGKDIESSHVLRGIGLSNDAAKSSMRFSLGRFTTEAEIAETISQIKTVLARQ